VARVSAHGAFLFLQALERQPNPSAIARKVLPRVAAHCSSLLPDVSASSFHRSFIVTMGRYGLRSHPSVLSVVRDLQRFAGDIHDRDLMPLLQCFADANLSPSTQGAAEVYARLEARLPELDMRAMDAVLDVLSVSPCQNNDHMMRVVMGRLSQECGVLSCHQMLSVVELISQYPPARDNGCMGSLLFAVSATKEAYETDSLQRVIIAFSRAQCFTPDLFAICEFAQSQRNGISRTFDGLMIFLSFLHATICREPRLLRIVIKAVEDVAMVMNNDEIVALQKEIRRLEIQHPALQQKLIGRLRQLQREAGDQRSRRYRRGYDPVDDLL
jgi:hypothetical protein